MCDSLTVIPSKLGTAEGFAHELVPCGRCYSCIVTKRKQWIYRLLQEWKRSINGVFITLTYEESQKKLSKDGWPTLSNRDLTLFIKKVRKRVNKRIPQAYKKNPIKYYSVGEYGEDTYRPHYHLIMFNVDEEMMKVDKILKFKNGISEGKNNRLTQVWGNGLAYIGKLTEKSIAYTCGYVDKKLKTWEFDGIVDFTTGEIHDDDRETEFANMSKNLGNNFLTEKMKKYLRENRQVYIMHNGYKLKLPRYYEDEIWKTDSEKRDLRKIKSEYWKKMEKEYTLEQRELAKEKKIKESKIKRDGKI